MKFVNTRELRLNASRLLKLLRTEDLIVTTRGRPAAALTYLDEDLLEDFILAHHPSILKETEEAYQEYKKKGGIGHEQMREKLKNKRK